MIQIDVTAMTDEHLIAAYFRACVRLGDVQGWTTDTDAPAQRTAFKRWEALDREMAKRKLTRQP